MRVALRIENFADKGNDSSVLRIPELMLRRGECILFAGLSREHINLLVHLITGVRSPESGSVRILGRDAVRLSDDDEWFGLVEKIGIFSYKIREDVSAAENLAGIFRAKERYRKEPALSSAVWRISRLVKLSILELAKTMRHADPAIRLKVCMGRALAWRPEILLLNAGEQDRSGMAEDLMLQLIRRVKWKTGCSFFIFSSDPWWTAVADRIFRWDGKEQLLIETKIRGWYHKLFSFVPARVFAVRQLSRHFMRSQFFAK